MRLVRLIIKNFRRFLDASVDLESAIVVLIGENDSGKTSLLDAIEILLGTKKAQAGDFTRSKDPMSEEVAMSIVGEFRWDGAPPDLPHKPSSGAAAVKLRRTITPALTSTLEMEAEVFSDVRIDDFATAGTAKAFLADHGVDPPGKNREERDAQLRELIGSGRLEKSVRWQRIADSDIAESIPLVRRISSDAYADPDAELNRLVGDAVRRQMAQLVEADPLTFAVASSAAKQAAEEVLRAVEPSVCRFIPDAKKLLLTPTVDFRRPHVECHVAVADDEGNSKPLREFGYGTRRRAWIGVDEARSRVRTSSDRDELRLFDEPDTALHYEAQRGLFRSIRAGVVAGTSRAVVSTHAVTLIDGAPTSALRIVRPNDGGTSTVVQFGLEDQSTLEAMDRYGPMLGLTNLALLYERAFLLVEGPTEERALQHLYAKCHGARLGDDGIRIVNLEGCGAWRSVVRTLFAMRRSLVFLLLDQDCSLPQSTAKLNAESLRELEIPSSAVSLIGVKEFEDAFPDVVWARVLNEEYQRHDGAAWEDADVARLRTSGKFSEEVTHLIHKESAPTTRSNASKPSLGDAIGRHCEVSEVPGAIRDTFEAVRRIAANGAA